MTSTGTTSAEANGPVSLAGEFPPATREQWVRAAAKALVRNLAPDDDPEQVIGRLRSTTYDGITIEPLYGPDTASPSVDAGYPGSSPFVRGRSAAGTRAEGWDVRQRVDASSSEFTAVVELERGATSIWLDLSTVDSIDLDSLRSSLAGVLLDLTSVTLAADRRWVAGADALLALWDAEAVPEEQQRGGFGADPCGEYASSGGDSDVAGDLDAAIALVNRLAGGRPGVRVVTIDATRYHDAGGSDGQELGFGLAAMVATLRAFGDAGIELADALARIEWRLAATADQFATIAKFRAARRLVARVAEVAGVETAAASVPVHAVTSAAMMSRYDPWVNLLRSTTACFGAGIGGADSITVLPYDAVVDRDGSELGRRIARNTQSILAKEANLSRVIDPGGGSWYIESLSDQIAVAAWSVFCEVEALGGFVAAVDGGFVAERLRTSWAARRRNIVTRRDPLTGVSEFPNVLEPVPPSPADSDAVAGASPSPDALPRHRYAEPFEALRQRVDRCAVESGRRPSVFLANVGAPAVHTARAGFAKNLFEIAGLVTIPGPGSIEPGEIAEQFAASGAAVACICSSDAVYADIGAKVAQALHEEGPTVLYLAGRPRDLIDSLTGSGVDGFIAAGSDVEQTLSDLLERLDVR